MNIVMLQGNLARDPELRSFTNGDKQTFVVNFTVAVSREFIKANGSVDKATSFIQCEAWDSGAQAISESLRKGDLVFVEGSIRNDSWEKDGVKHSTYKIRVNNFGRFDKVRRRAETVQSVSAEDTVAF